MAVSEAIENYLETIYILSQQQNEVHAIDICSYLSYSARRYPSFCARCVSTVL